MQGLSRVLAASALLLAPAGAGAVPLNRIYLVPALVQCVGAATCVPREFESRYTFDSIVLRTPATRYMPADAPSLYLEVRGVRDPSGAPFTGNLTLRVSSGRIGLPSLGTFPDDSPLTAVAPVSIPIQNGRNRRFAYRPPQPAPNGTIVNGGGVEVFDPEGKRLAVTGSQSKP
jgi:hypothetical protein